MNVRTARQVGAEITLEWQAFLDCELAGDILHAARHYERMDELVEEHQRLVHPRLPSDRDGHTAPQPA